MPTVEEAWNHSVTNEMAQRQMSLYRQQSISGMSSDEHFAKRHKSEVPVSQRNFPQSSYHFADNLQSNQIAQQQKSDSSTNFKGNQNELVAGFSLPNNKISSNIPMSNLKNSQTSINQASKTNRSYRDSIDSDVTPNQTHSSDDSSNCTSENKEPYSSQINNFNTANSVFSNVSLITKEKEEAITSLLYSPYPQLLSTDSSQTHPSNKPMSIEMTSQDIIDHCNNLPIDAKIVSSIVSDDGRPPYPPDPPYPPLPKDKLYPPTPSVTVCNIYFDNQF